ENKKPETGNEKLIPIKYNENLKIISMAFLVDKSDAVIWRGPLKHNVIKQLLNDVEWGNLDYLIIDFPPGTGDEAISVSQLLGSITGTIIVSTPQEVALLDATRAINFTRKMGTPVLGLIENMSGDVFGEGNVEETAKKEKVPFLGRIKLSPKIRKSGDLGSPVEVNNLFNAITEKIRGACEKEPNQ
ncbi:P-loop NTPase, partial [Candidatus Micrarchaeota archaeon]|nr:P-loop NTPase [Candidatus Micrarchaeota archaeon]